jgi:hypothetical protein
LAALHHKEDDQMEHSQYRHFPSRAREGVDDVVFPTEGRDHIGCLANQVKLTHALARDLDEAVKEIQQLGNLREEASRGIIELEALCKQKEDARKKLEGKANLKGMIQSCDELIMEMADEFGLNHMGEDNDDQDEDDEEDDSDEEDDNNDRGDTTAPCDATPPPCCHATCCYPRGDHH